LKHHHYIRSGYGHQEAIVISSREKWIRFVGLILAAALLNLGLYFILFFVAPLVSGLICGYFMLSPRWGALGGFLGAFLPSTPLLFFLEAISGHGYDPFSIVFAAVILSVIGAVGGFLGGMIALRTQKQMQS
jgi:hypothetical protein